MFVAYLSNFDSLQRTRAAYYDRQRFADVFASLQARAAAPRGALARASPASPPSRRASVADVTLDVPGVARAGRRAG